LSKKYNKKGPVTKNKNVKPITEKHSGMKSRPALNISFLHFIPLCFSLIIFSILWFKPFNVNLKDPWNKGGLLLDSANKTTDPNQRNILVEKAGKILAEQVQKHPYHARVHYMYGYYWFMLQNWDSTIFHQKEAIRIGAGGIVNQVEFAAQDILNAALNNKVPALMNSGNLKEAADVLENAKTPQLLNPNIDKYKGAIYSRQGNADSALFYFLRYQVSNPNDANNLTNIAISYNQKNMRDSALIYVNQALKLEPTNANANLIKSQINSQ
jgi:tetratricopeptide (TPR) repeat protein